MKVFLHLRRKGISQGYCKAHKRRDIKFLATLWDPSVLTNGREGGREERREQGRKEEQNSAHVLTSRAVSSVYRKPSVGAFSPQQSPSGILQAAV